MSVTHLLMALIPLLVLTPCHLLDGSGMEESTGFYDIYNSKMEAFLSDDGPNNWAVLIDTSRFWFNYRHVANVLSIYRSVRRLGIPDSHIILMLADDVACDPRNTLFGSVLNSASGEYINVYGTHDSVEVDYRGREVTVENVVRLFTGRWRDNTPESKRLNTNARSRVLVYMTGHGGDGFLKFQDSEELTATELADVFAQMHEQRRYSELLFMIDTCQAASMYADFHSPNILAIASSQTGEDSLSHDLHPDLGVYVIDKYTYYALAFLETVQTQGRETHTRQSHSVPTLRDLCMVCGAEKYGRKCVSTVGVRSDLFVRNLSLVPIIDFFGSRRSTFPMNVSDNEYDWLVEHDASFDWSVEHDTSPDWSVEHDVNSDWSVEHDVNSDWSDNSAANRKGRYTYVPSLPTF